MRRVDKKEDHNIRLLVEGTPHYLGEGFAEIKGQRLLTERMVNKKGSQILTAFFTLINYNKNFIRSIACFLYGRFNRKFFNLSTLFAWS